MRIPHLMLVVSAAGAISFLQVANAADNQSQAKAREALRQKVSELEAQPASVGAPSQTAQPSVAPRSQTPAAAPKTQAPAVAPKTQTPAGTPKAQTPAVSIVRERPAESAAIVKAREAMREQMQRMESDPPAAGSQTASAAAGESSAVAAAGPSEAGNIDKARQALRQKVSQLPAEPEPRPTVQSGKRSMQEEFPPIERPASTLAGDKQEKLRELLRRYMEDEVSPQEYHRERARILSEK